MLNVPVRTVPGTEQVDARGGAYYTLPSLTAGLWMFTAETTATVFQLSDRPLAAFATEGHILPRDKSIILQIGKGERFQYYTAVGGTLRWVEVKPIQP